MKLLIINGSPRAGNTKRLLKSFEVGARTNIRGLAVETIALSDFQLLPCSACDACFETGHCIHQDASNLLVDKVLSADAIVFGTPVYWWGMSAQLKILIDKFYMWHAKKYQVGHKTVGIISVGGDVVGSEQYDLIENQFKCIFEFLKWDYAFKASFSAYAVGDIDKDLKALASVEALWEQLL